MQKACDFGDPQIRRRIFVVASLWCIPLPNQPQPRYGISPDKPFVTVQDIENHLNNIKQKDGDDDDDDWDNNNKIPNWYDCRSTSLKPGEPNTVILDPNAPACTITASGGDVIFYKDKPLSVAFVRALMSLPDQYEILGPDKYRQLGNGVAVKHMRSVVR